MRVFTGILVTILLLTCLMTSPGAMQLKMVMEHELPDSVIAAIHTIRLDKVNGINVNIKEDGEHHAIIWNRIKNIAYMVNFTEGTYWTMTEEDAAKVKKMQQEVMPRMKAQQEQIQKLFEEQMKDLSEAERKEAMKHLPGGMGMGMGQEAETVWEKVGSESVGQWDADIWVGRRYGQMVEKVWAVGWDQLGVDESYLGVFADFSEFAGGFMEEGDGPFNFSQVEEEQGYPGLPVIVKIFGDDEELESTQTLKELKTEESDPDTYGLPITDPPLDPTKSPMDEMPTDMPGMPNMPPGY